MVRPQQEGIGRALSSPLKGSKAPLEPHLQRDIKLTEHVADVTEDAGLGGGHAGAADINAAGEFSDSGVAAAQRLEGELDDGHEAVVVLQLVP
jgi:hypothetical protein